MHARVILASLDVENLFINIQVDHTINYITKRVHYNSTPKLNIPEVVLRTLIERSTKEAPFFCPRGNRYRQIDGVAIGSPLGVLLANSFMGIIEEEVFSTTEKTYIYCRYIEDIFIKSANEECIELLRLILQKTSGLTLTTESSADEMLPFLDILVKQIDNSFNKGVYVKATNSDHCLHGESECPQRYKDTTIRVYVGGTLTHCSTCQ
ncbi:uncharacterized protein LOC143037008 [Oratosquilla oratoria]|uniref:uncharacterized protein LOC143037008 n=1 Tax=Oratosquilla oratoria TaxID=337810 RepID=UPI003F765DBF